MFVSIGSSIFAWSLSGLTELFPKDVFNSDRKDYCRSGRGEKSMSSWFLFFFFFCLEDLILAVFLLQEGCWGLMDEFHKINMECLSVMLFEIQAVLLALRGGLSTCTLEDGKDVCDFKNCCNVVDNRDSYNAGYSGRVGSGQWTRGGEVLVQALALVTRSQGLSPPFALKSNKNLPGKVVAIR